MRVDSTGHVSPTRVLILGGSSEATALVAALASCAGLEATLSLAGRTASPATVPIPTRIGGFGGVDGLVAYLLARRIDVLVDATHPFAAQISCHARAAAAQVGCPLIDVVRPGWVPQPGDCWTEVATMADAVVALGRPPRRVFLTVGRLQLAAFASAPQHVYLVRTIDPVEPAMLLHSAIFIQGRGPFDVNSEERLMSHHRIEVLVTKNSGGAAAAAKLEAARRLGLPVVLVRRPEPNGASVGIDEAVARIVAHRSRAVLGV